MNAIEKKLNASLIQALSALSDMWNQYCPPPFSHQFMSSGEFAEEVLETWGLIDADGNAAEPQWAEDDLPPQLTPPPAKRPLSSLSEEEAKELFTKAFYYWNGYEELHVRLSKLSVEIKSEEFKLLLTQEGVVVASKESQNACTHARFNAVAVVRYLDALGIEIG